MYVLILCIGFHEESTKSTFGILKKGVYRPLSDFNFHFIMKVVSERSTSTGYLVKVLPEASTVEESERLSKYEIITYQL